MPYVKMVFTPRQCAKCVQTFIPKHKNNKFCSEHCQFLAYHVPNTRAKRPCSGCRHLFQPKSRAHAFCSVECTRIKRKTLDTIQPLVREYFLERANFECEQCGTPNNYNLELHHKLPLYRGGEDCADNIAVICDTCHKNEHRIF